MSEDIINRRAIQWFPGHMAKTWMRASRFPA